MIDDKKIEEAARYYCNNRYPASQDAPFIAEWFRLGAKWAVNELLKNLWHPASEIPKEFNYYGFTALYILQYNQQIKMILYDKDCMNWKNVISNNEYWLYVDDLLPKEGGEQ